MELEIKWTKEDIEKKLRVELKQSGFRPIEVKYPEKEDDSPEAEKKRQRRQTFTWSFKPQITVRVKAEPDPDAILDDDIVSDSPTPPDTDEDESADVGVSLDPTKLPPGSAEAIERAIKAEKKGKKVNRKKIPGETDERPY